VRFKKLTPLMTVDAIEPCLPFWTDRLGFAKVAEVPDGDALGFVILAKDGLELMYQSHASVEKDLGTRIPVGGLLYIEVEDLAPILTALAGAEVVVPERTTFYGAREIFVREPGGHVVAFSQHGAH
jgi:uncharacterized glyoxalase superfamily protein PhnB